MCWLTSPGIPSVIPPAYCGNPGICHCYIHMELTLPIIDCSGKNIHTLPTFNEEFHRTTETIYLQNNIINELTINTTLWDNI